MKIDWKSAAIGAIAVYGYLWYKAKASTSTTTTVTTS
jgi:hypothetical protein